MSLGGALVQSGYITGKTVMLTGQALARLPKHKEEVSGVVGTYEVTRQFISSDIMKTLLVLGLISLSLAIINLLPLLPLDGGHAFWLIVEAIRRKPASEQTMFLANALGFCFIIGLFFLGLSNDISSIQNGGFKTR
jgi:regulator of sigma E protease